jgi:hypothetical protein
MPQIQEPVKAITGATIRSKDPLWAELLAEGHIVAWRGANRTEYSAPAPARSLADLLELAATAVDDSLPPQSRGRRTSVDEARTVFALNTKAFTRIRTACNAIARYLQPDAKPAQYREVLSGVGTTHFVWDPSAGEGGAGDWRLMLDLVGRASADGTRYENVSAVRKLMDLAATHCWIPRSPRHDPDYQAVPTEWAPVYEEYRLALAGSGLTVKAGLLALFEGCHRLGLYPGDADWARVIEHMEDHFEAHRVASSRRSEVRRVYNALLSDRTVDGPVWDGRARQRSRGIVLVTAAGTSRIGELYGSDTAQEGLRTKPTWDGFDHLGGLVEGIYGLRRMITHFACEAAAAQAYGVPSRAEYPRVEIRKMGPRSKAAWRAETTSAALQNVLFYAGWLTREHGVEFTQEGSDLRVLLDEGYLRLFYDAVLRGEVGTKDRLRRVAQVLARVASPYLETTALDAGNVELADQMASVSAMLASPKASSWTSLLTMSPEERIQRERRKALAVRRAWTRDGDLAEFAHDRLVVVRDELLRQISELAGYSLEKQVQLLSENTWHPTRQWARMVRDALYWQDQIVVPLRVSTSKRLDRSERVHASDFGRINAGIPAAKMKTPGNGDLDPNYAVPGACLYSRELYALYVMPGGARDILRTNAEGTLHSVAAFYVPDLATTNARRLDAAWFRDAVDRVVSSCEHVLGEGVTFASLKEAGALGTHFFRHAFATKMVRKGLADVAALYLHQKGTDMLRRVYDASGAGDFCPSAQLI